MRRARWSSARSRAGIAVVDRLADERVGEGLAAQDVGARERLGGSDEPAHVEPGDPGGDGARGRSVEHRERPREPCRQSGDARGAARSSRNRARVVGEQRVDVERVAAAGGEQRLVAAELGDGRRARAARARSPSSRRAARAASAARSARRARRSRSVTPRLTRNSSQRSDRSSSQCASSTTHASSGRRPPNRARGTTCPAASARAAARRRRARTSSRARSRTRGSGDST